MKIKFNPSKCIKPLSLFILALLILLFSLISIAMNKILTDNTDAIAQNGKLDISGEFDAKEDYFYLQGEWNYYEDVFLTPENFDKSLLTGNILTALPNIKVSQSSGTATYKLDFKFDNTDGLLIYVPYLQNNINVFLNGKLLRPVSILRSEIGIGKALFEVSNYDITLEYQQLVISTNKNPSDTTFYKRYVIFSSLKGINSILFATSISQFMFLAFLLITALNGFIFIFLYPRHKMISVMTLFDTLLMIMITINLSAVMGFYTNLIPGFIVHDSLIVTLKVVILTITGAFGIILSKEIFDPQFKLNKKIWYNATISLCIFFALLFLFDIRIYDNYGIILINFSIFLGLTGVAKRCIVYYKQHGFTGYFIFQMIKTLFIGVLLLIDSFMQYTSIYTNMLFFSFYLLFFVCHIILRLYDNYTSYLEVDRLNTKLETIVIARTQDLSTANEALQKNNEILSELSIKDALTKIYNRLYFEQKVEDLTTKFGTAIQSLHLCMFDLDFFKNINDRFGHQQGDIELIEMTTEGNKLLPDDCIFSRIGGEEFAILFINKSDTAVATIVESIRKKLEDESIKKDYATTASFGISKYEKDLDKKEWFIRADKALYRAKSNGRNTIVQN